MVLSLSGPVEKQSASFFRTFRYSGFTFAESYAKYASASVIPQALRMSSSMFSWPFVGSLSTFAGAGGGATAIVGAAGSTEAAGETAGLLSAPLHATARQATDTEKMRLRDFMVFDSVGGLSGFERKGSKPRDNAVTPERRHSFPPVVPEGHECNRSPPKPFLENYGKSTETVRRSAFVNPHSRGKT